MPFTKAKYIFVALLCFSLFSVRAYAQELSFPDTLKVYNAQRINTNITGMKVLGGWGVANVAAGGITYFSTTGQTKYFGEMNGILGLVNTGVAAVGLIKAQQQRAMNPGYQQSYDQFLTSKRIYLVSACVDVLYIGAGVGLVKYGQNNKANADVYNGIGKSLVAQGIFLLLFNNVMLAAHVRRNARWVQFIDEVRVTHNGIGFNHTF